MKQIDTPKLIATLGFIAIMFVFWRYAYPCALAYHEQMQLFLWNCDYFMERLAEPGGMARYLAEMMVQHYNNLMLGALLVTLLMTIIQQLTWLLLRRWGCKDTVKNYLLSFLSPLVVWGLMGDMDVMTTLPVAVALTLGMMVLAPQIPVWTVCYSLFIAVVGYWIAGPMAVVGAVCIMARLAIRSEKGCRPLLAMLTVTVVGVAVVWGSCCVLPYSVSRIIRGIDYYRDPTVFLPRCWYTSNVYQQLDYSMLVRQQEWEDIISKASNGIPVATASVAAVKLAQWKTGRINDAEIQNFISTYSKLDHPVNICMKNDLFFHLGLVNASRRYAFEFKQLIGNNNQSGRIIKRLAETELVSGHYKLARKYLYILRDATYYRKWAEKILPLTYNAKLVEAHPLYGPLSKSFPEKDYIY